MEISILLSAIIKMGVMIGLGLLISRYIPLTPDIKRFMIFLIVNIALPGLILNGILQLKINSELLVQILIIFSLSFLLNCLGLFAAWVMTKAVKSEAHKALEIGILSSLGNTGLIGIPLCATLFGPKGALFAAVFDTGMALTLWSVAVMLLKKDRKITFSTLKATINMPVLAVIAGLSIAILKINPPAFVKDFTGSLAQMASPVAMIYIGMLISSIMKSKQKVPSLRLALPVSFKLIIFPMLTLLFILVLPIQKEIAEIIFIEVAMPTITTASIVFARYDADEQLALTATLVSTLLSLLTIPAVIYIGRILVIDRLIS